MNTLPILQKNAYLTILVKDNCIFANLAYTDIHSNRSYIISDTTDLSPLKLRMDDLVFTESFWYEYFDQLEKVFDWEIVDRKWQGIFKFVDFVDEGNGLSGIKVLIDDRQPFFKNIYTSLNEISKDISVRILDDTYTKNILNGMMERLGYRDVVFLDLDVSHFTYFRASRVSNKEGLFSKDRVESLVFESGKIDWDNEIGLIDSINSSKLKAFLSTDRVMGDISDRWANFIAQPTDVLNDPVLEDVLRSFTTVQNLTIRGDNKLQLDTFGRVFGTSAIFITGRITTLLPQNILLLSLIDGFELMGTFDVFIDTDYKLLSYGKNLLDASKSKDMIVFKNDVLPKAIKTIIPELRTFNAKNKVIFSGKIESQSIDSRDIFCLNPNFELIHIPESDNNIVIEGEFKNGAYINTVNNRLEIVSSMANISYSGMLIDGRFRPVIYGPKMSDNRNKLHAWLNGSKI